jgi:hypothetical protein
MTSSQSLPVPRLLRAALSAVAMGFVVFPVAPRSKTPAVKDWENQATHDTRTITGWFRARPYNVGIATGPSDLVVVDLDHSHGHPAPPPWTGATGGRDVLARLAAAGGHPIPDDTFTVSTPTGGEHLYFRAPDGVALRNTAAALGWRIDTRAHGGFIVGAGSVRDEGPYRITRHARIAPLPGWLTDSLLPTQVSATELPTETELRLPPGRAAAYLTAIIDSETRAVADARTGERHRILLHAARTLGRLVAGGELTEPAAREALLDASAAHIGVDGTTAREVTQTIDDGLAYGAGAPRTIRGSTSR